MATTEKPPLREISRDAAITDMVTIAREGEISTVWDRYRSQQPQCKFATDGVCCRLCHMGPCRITPKAKYGICGADADTIAARNLLREIAAGSAAHSDHGRGLVRTLKLVAEGKSGEYKISDPIRLREVARFFGIETDGRGELAIAGAVADFFAGQFGWSGKPNRILELAPAKRQELWKKLEIEPDGIDATIVEVMHRTHMGVDSDYANRPAFRKLFPCGCWCQLFVSGGLIAIGRCDDKVRHTCG